MGVQGRVGWVGGGGGPGVGKGGEGPGVVG